MAGGQIKVVSKTVFVEDEIQRPADTTQYTAGDVVANSTSAGIARHFRFLRAARTNGAGGIVQSVVLIDSTAETTKPDLELYLFDVKIPMQADNAAWAPTDADMEHFIGWVSLLSTTFKVAGGNGVIQTQDKGLAFVCQPTSVDIFGILVVRNAYTPISAEQFRLRLGILQD